MFAVAQASPFAPLARMAAAVVHVLGTSSCAHITRVVCCPNALQCESGLYYLLPSRFALAYQCQVTRGTQCSCHGCTCVCPDQCDRAGGLPDSQPYAAQYVLPGVCMHKPV